MRSRSRTLLVALPPALVIVAGLLYLADRGDLMPPAARRPVILALGDSLTSGWGVGAGQSYPEQLQQLLDANGYRYRVVNAGIAGETTGGGLARVDRLLAAYRPEIVILELGANDGLQQMPVAEIRANLSRIIERVQAAGARVLLAGMMLPPSLGKEYTRQFREIYPALAAKYDVTLMPFFLAGVAGRPDLNQPDGLHPTGRGYAVVAENLFEVLRPLLQTTAAANHPC